MFRIFVHNSIESILVFVLDDTERSSTPGLVATIHLARVGIKISAMSPGKGGNSHTSTHAFGARNDKKSATDRGMFWDGFCGH